jgi:hypothetical protein
MLNPLSVRHRPTTRDPVAPHHTTTIPTITGITGQDFGVLSRITAHIRIGAARASLTTGVRIGAVHGEATGVGGKRKPRAPDNTFGLAPRETKGRAPIAPGLFCFANLPQRQRPRALTRSMHVGKKRAVI